MATTPVSPRPKEGSSGSPSSEGDDWGGLWRRLKKRVSEPFIKVSPTSSRDGSFQEATAAQRMREANEAENNKTRIKDMIRRDLLFYPTFRNALQGNSERTPAALRYSELYERYKNIYAPLLYDDPEDGESASNSSSPAVTTTPVAAGELATTSVVNGDGEDAGGGEEAGDGEEAGSNRASIPNAVSNEDVAWAKSNLEDNEIAEELTRIHKKLRDRNEIRVLLTGAKRQVLGAGFKTVRWEQKTPRELEELFGSEERAIEVQKLEGEKKERTLNSVKEQIRELAKYQEEIAHHYAFCQEILKRASDASHIDSLVLKLKPMALAHRDEWAIEIGRELAKRKKTIEREEELKRKMRDEISNKPDTHESKSADAHPDAINAQTLQEESLLYELSSQALNVPKAPKSGPPAVHPGALKRLLNLEAGGSLHLPRSVTLDFSSEEHRSRTSVQQDEDGTTKEARTSPAEVLVGFQERFVSTRKPRRPPVNELFAIGTRASVINPRGFYHSTVKCKTNEQDDSTQSTGESRSNIEKLKQEETEANKTKQEEAKVGMDEHEASFEEKEQDEEVVEKRDEEAEVGKDEDSSFEEKEQDKTVVGKREQEEDKDFVIVFKYGNKAYRCSEKEKTILERQVKVLDPSTFQMLLDDFQLEVFAVLDDLTSPREHKSEEEEEEPEQMADTKEGEKGGKEETKDSTNDEKKQDESPTQTNTKPRGGKRRKRRRRKYNAGVWGPRSDPLAEKTNTMRDTMRRRMQQAYEEEVRRELNRTPKKGKAKK